ncbi:Ribosomal RNA-processing protein 8 [Abortiporus biennis]
MALFEVPGWIVPSAPVTTNKKRKRPSAAGDSNEKIHSAQVNMDKLMSKLADSAHGTGDTPQKKKKKPKLKRTATESTNEAGSSSPVRETSHKPIKPKNSGTKSHKETSEADPKSGQKQKGSKEKKKPADLQATEKSAPKQKGKGKTEDGLTAMQASMKNSLDGARFRWINETLYKSESEQAHQLMKENPAVFDEYHTGFRHQVQSWPSNPVQLYISSLSSYQPKTVIADLGCGDAALAKALTPKGYTVLSFDLVSDGKFVIESDICSKIPLPGSEDSDEDSGHVVDVVVCALSLMGTNWPKCIMEAWRILRPGGELKVAEVASRFTDVEAFVSLVSSIGFKLRTKNDKNSHFTLFEFTKSKRTVKSDKEWARIQSKGDLLKPCEYKRR